MRVYGMLFSALATAAMTGPAGARPAKPSTIAAVDVTRDLPAGSYAGVTYRYVEGVIHGEVSAIASVAGLSELAAGRATMFRQITRRGDKIPRYLRQGSGHERRVGQGGGYANGCVKPFAN